MTLTIDQTVWEKIKKQINSSRLNDIVNKWLMAAGFDLERDIVEEIVTKNISNTGRLLQGWTVEKVGNDSVRVFTNVSYAPYVEYGTRPHTPPLEPIIEWARLKFQLNDARAKQVGGAVWQAIRKRGTQGQHYVEDAMRNFNLNTYVDHILKDWESQHV